MRKPLLYLLILFGALIIYLNYRDHFLSLAFLQQELQSLLKLKEKFPMRFFVVFEILFLLLTSFSIPGSIFLTILGGMAFGNFWGSLLVTLNCSIGGTISFFLLVFF